MTITVKSLHSECPAQWEGKSESGADIYIRYRWGQLTLSTVEQIAGLDLYNRFFQVDHGHEMQGQMSDDEMISLLAPFGYEIFIG